MDERLETILREPSLSWLLDRLVQRLRSGSRLDAGTLTRADATPDERRAVDNLFGRSSSRGRSLNVDLAHLAHHLDTDAVALERAVIALRGPVSNRRAERESQAAEWAALFSLWKDRVSDHAWAIPWLEKLADSGQMKRLAGSDIGRADELLRNAWAILEPAPHADISLASLAAQVTGDSHALDRGKPLSGLCLRAIAGRDHGIDGTTGAGARRQAWATLGVSVDDLSAPALCLNLSVASTSELDPWIGWHVSRGEPFYLTWRQLRNFIPATEMDEIFVCENPAIVSEAAQRLGSKSRPLICTNGMPSATVKRLLQLLTAHPITVHLRADFDWPGLTIIRQLRDTGQTRPWRMSAADYRQCTTAQALGPTPSWLVTPGEDTWFGDLIAAMEESGMAAYEESLIDRLIEDLS